MFLAIGEVAKRAGVTVDALRYYEHEGLLPIPERTTAGHRRYTESVLLQVEIITTLRSVGASISQIRHVVGAKKPGTSAAERVAALREALDDIAHEVMRQRAALDAADALLAQWLTELDAGEPYSDTPLPK